MFKKVVIFLSLLACVTCSGHGPSVLLSNDNKKIYKSSVCDPEKSFPQMVLIPFFKRATQIVPNCQTYPKHKTALSLLIFYHIWNEYFGDRDFAVKGMLEQVMIQWGTNKKTSKSGYSLNGTPFKNRKIIGRVESDNMIWVWQGYRHEIAQSALIHELVHLAMLAKYGHPDVDHEGPKYRGWTPAHSAMIIECKEMLAAFNI